MNIHATRVQSEACSLTTRSPSLSLSYPSQADGLDREEMGERDVGREG